MAQHGFIHLHNFTTDGIYGEGIIILSQPRSGKLKPSVKLTNSIVVPAPRERTQVCNYVYVKNNSKQETYCSARMDCWWRAVESQRPTPLRDLIRIDLLVPRSNRSFSLTLTLLDLFIYF